VLVDRALSGKPDWVAQRLIDRGFTGKAVLHI